MKNDYEIRGNQVAIFLKRRDGIKLETLIDLADFEKVILINKWYAKKKNGLFYVGGSIKITKGKHKAISLHRYLLNPPDNLVIDHINRNPLDNTRENLRIVTHAQNLQNLSVNKNNSSGVRGVRWHKAAGRWSATVRAKEFNRFEEFFDTKEEAIEAVIKARRQLMPYSEDVVNG